jgi:hypothetical protein
MQPLKSIENMKRVFETKMVATMKKVLFVLCCWAIGITAFAQIADESEYLSDLRQELQEKHPKNRLINLVFRGHSVPSGYFSTPDYKDGDTWFTQSRDGKKISAIACLKEGEKMPAQIDWKGN